MDPLPLRLPSYAECAGGPETTPKRPPITEPARFALASRITQATAKVSASNEKFNKVLDRFPGGPAHPGGVQEIKEASRELTIAREEMMIAHRQLNDFIQRGIVPADLKRNG